MSSSATRRRKRPSAPQLRLRQVSLLAVLAVAGLGIRLAAVQVLDGARYSSYLQGEVEQSVAIPAIRGAIYDRLGDALAVSVPRTNVIADDFQITDPSSEARTLALLMKVGVDTLTSELSEHNGYVVIGHSLTANTVDPIEAAGLAGLSFAPDTVRVSSGGATFQPLLGGVNAAGEGDAGVEYAYNDLLAGTPGSEQEAVSPNGITLPSAARDVVAARAGTGLVLTIDQPLQVEATRDVAAEMLTTHAKSGIAVVMDVHTGAILAMVDLVAGKHATIVPAAQNLAVTSVYQPGSVMKLATFSYALQDGLITPNTVFTVPYSLNIGGFTFQDADYHPTEEMPASEILAQSSNIGTIEVSERLGLTRLAEAFKALGFGQYTGLNWPGESPGIIGSPATWYGSSAGSVPIGTGVAVTPLQVLDAYNIIANDGVFVTPHLVSGVVSGNGTEHLLATPPGQRRIDASTVSELVPMLEGVVQDGTAVLAHIPGYTVAGKTGTAQVPEPDGAGYSLDDYNATFCGFVPAQQPQLSGIVVLNHPTPIYGGSVSAPVFSEIMRYALRRFDIAPPSTTTALTSTLGAGAR